MKSSLWVDIIDRGTGRGQEPVIRAEVKNSQDPRDKLLSTLFQSIGGSSFLQLYYSNQKHTTTSEGLPDMEKTILLFQPESQGEILDSLNSLIQQIHINKGAAHQHPEIRQLLKDLGEEAKKKIDEYVSMEPSLK